ncbi:MAG TPA: response regulator [Flavobacteriales bacterium]|nr:response regulator [Flavobacteriales bacterium]HMU15036.1 response regulator [Flavobacteriales bacterium]
MSKLRIAVLEDDHHMLDRLVRLLKGIDAVEVVTATDDAAKFRERVRAKAPDALLLDIEILGDRHAGLDMAQEFALPVLFISGKTREDLLEIERIQRLREHLPVEHLTKPYNEIDLRHAVNKLLRLTHAADLNKPIPLKLGRHGDELMVPPERIVFVEVHPDKKQADSQNKLIHFTDREPMVWANVTLEKLIGTLLPEHIFIQISSKCIVNKNRISKKGRDGVIVEACDKDRKPVRHPLKVTDTFRNRLA